VDRVTCRSCGRTASEFDLRCPSCGGALPSRVEAYGEISATIAAPPVEPAEEPCPARIAHYEVEARLGAGGMGVVYRARDPRLGRAAAVKVIAPALAGDATAKARFLREARTASRLDHPGIAPIYEVGEHEGRLYLAMALCEGETLKDRVARGPVPLAEAIDLLAQIAAALEAAHAAGIVHRDVKPANVMIGPGGHVRLLDFGLAKPLDAEAPASTLTERGELIGTPAYMSPERLSGDEGDHRADLWALGVVACEMLTGRSPFAGPGGRVAELGRILGKEPASLRAQGVRAPAALEALVASLLEKDPARRCQSAAEVTRALAAVAAGPLDPGPFTEEAPPSPPPPRPVPGDIPPRAPATRGRARRWIGVTALAALALLAGAWRLRREAAPPPRIEPPASPLAAPSAVLACPIFEASGVEAPAGWLGAAAAHRACDWATGAFGALDERTRVPAELLDLPRRPADDFPADPFGSPGARERSLRAARERADAYLDGAVEKSADGFALALRLHARDGREIARSEARGRVLFEVAEQAVGALVAAGALPAASAVLDPVLREAMPPGPVGVELARIDERITLRTRDALDTRAECDRALARSDLTPSLDAYLREVCGRPGKAAATVLDRSSPYKLAGSSWRYAREHPEADVVALAQELDLLRASAPSAALRSLIAGCEAELWLVRGDKERARALLVTAVEDRPRMAQSIRQLEVLTAGTTASAAVARLRAAWEPDASAAWYDLAQPFGEADPARAELLSRAHHLGEDSGAFFGVDLARTLLARGRREEARAIGSRYATGTEARHRVGEYVLALVDLDEGVFGRALDRLRAASAAAPAFGSIDTTYLAFALLDTADVLGRSRAIADEWIDHFIPPEGPRITSPAPPRLPLSLAGMCRRASRDRAERCFAAFDGLVKSGAFVWGTTPGTDAYVEGARRFARGDVRGAAEAWRPMTRLAGAIHVPADVYDAVGDEAVAAALDATLLRERRFFHGINLAFVREAKRALRRGDKARARALAQQVVDAWSLADVEVPAVKEMRQILARLPAG
jgi:serine/threonine protein kinase